MTTALRQGDAHVNGVRIRFLEGGPTNGEPLVFVHGIGGGVEDWWANLGYFAERGYRVLAPSMPCHGESDFPPPEEWDPLDSGQTLIGLLDAWGVEKAPVVGHSAGGTAAILAAAAAPERITCLALAAPGGLGHPGWPLRVFSVPILGELFWQPWLLRRRRTQLAVVADVSNVDPHILDQWIGRHRSVAQRRAFLRLLRRGVSVHGLKADADLRRRVHDIRCPTLLIWGSKDAVIPPPPTRDEQTPIWPRAHFRLIKNAGHWPQAEQPPAFNHVTDTFLHEGSISTHPAGTQFTGAHE